jgi:hypothetical protein
MSTFLAVAMTVGATRIIIVIAELKVAEQRTLAEATGQRILAAGKMGEGDETHIYKLFQTFDNRIAVRCLWYFANEHSCG